MFTGIIETLGRVVRLDRQGADARVMIAATWADGAHPGVALGDSVAINGTCLTVVEFKVQGDGVHMAFDASYETLKLTSLGDLGPGSICNLERALRVGDRLGGHVVSGHVDGTGKLVACDERGGCWDLTYWMPPEIAPEVAHKGSIAIDGVSLTVNDVSVDRFRVTVIPHTADNTQLLQGGVGKRVNLESDVLAKYVRRLATFEGSAGVTRALLAESGFLE